MTPLVQSEFRFPDDARAPRDLAEYLGDRGRVGVDLTLTRNRVSMICVRFPGPGRAAVRLHGAFLRAPADVLAALRTYLRTRRREAWRVVGDFARGIEPGHAAGRRPARRLCAAGRVHDLRGIRDEVARSFFRGRVSCAIGWGVRPRLARRSRASRWIRFGSWNPDTRTVRVHPALDDERVPPEFVRYIVFHEMLHAVVEARSEKGRRRVHTAEFRALERAFPDWAGMQRLARSLAGLLTAGRRPLRGPRSQRLTSPARPPTLFRVSGARSKKDRALRP